MRHSARRARSACSDRKGWRVVLACATLGQQGKRGDPPVCGIETLGAVSERELREAARILDISAVHLLGYEDKALADAPRDEIRRMLVAWIRAERPGIVFTFDPNGFNAHPDHVAISRFTSDAVSAAADARWYPELGAAHVVPQLLWTSLLEPWEERAGAGGEPSADVVLDVSAWADRKAAALRAHRTQHLSIDRYFLSKPNVRRLLSVEIWRRAWPVVPVPSVFT